MIIEFPPTKVGDLTVMDLVNQTREMVDASGSVEVPDTASLVLQVSAAGNEPGALDGLAGLSLMALQLTAGFTDESASAFPQLASVGTLVVQQASLSAAGVATLAERTRPSSVGLFGIPLDDLESFRGIELTSFATDRAVSDISAVAGPTLTSFDCTASSPGLDDEAAAVLATCTGLQRLTLNSPSLTSKGAAAIVSSCQALATVTVTAPLLDDDGVAALASLPALTVLALPDAPAVTDKGLRALVAEALSLTQLRINAPSITDDGVAALAGLTALASLSIAGGTLTPAVMATVAGMKALTWLTLPAGAFDEQSAKALASLESLKDLNVAGAPSDVILALHSGLPSVTINGTVLTAAALARMERKRAGAAAEAQTP